MEQELNTPLINIIDDIYPDEDVMFFNNDEALELYETCKAMMEEFIKNNKKMITDPDFEDIFDENIEELIKAHFDSDIFYNDDAEDELDEIIEYAKTDFFKDFMPPRSYSSSIIIKEPNIPVLGKQIDVLRNKPQPVQRTKEWYEFRHNLITASNAYKAFDSQCNKNQLIYEKCHPLNPNNYVSDEPTPSVSNDETIKHIQLPSTQPQPQPQNQMVNVNSTLHWGQKYEPLSVLIYEHMFKTTIEDFGCIQHEQYPFLGASPDGINVDTNSLRYGRMLEIKNIVNREIDGIPKKEYWIQMQLQMEVCNLNECDFLETKFIEYDNADAYWSDAIANADTNDTANANAVKKGVIMYFHTKEGIPFYKYMPLNIVTFKDVSEWQEQMIDLYQSSEYRYIWIKDCYWKLAILSCVLVCRNQQWFNDNIGELGELWTIIEKERVSGFEHRAPNRKTKGENAFQLMAKAASTNAAPKKCLLQFNKENGKITILKSDPTVTTVESIVIDKLDINIDI